MSKFGEFVKNAFWVILLLQIVPPFIKSAYTYVGDIMEPKNKVGLIIIDTPIMSSGSINKQLKTFFKDQEIKAILLKIDSPGGAAGSSESITQEILRLKIQYPKPIVAYSENVCASGAYMIAAATDYVITTRNAIVGSIGAKISTQFKVQELLHKHDIQTHSIASGDYKNSLDPFVPMTPEREKMLQDLIDDCGQQFVADIAACRHIPLSQKSVWAEGRIFTGNDALKLKLIDQVGNQSVALDYIKQHILHADRELQLIKKPKPSRISQLFNPETDEDDDLVMSLGSSLSKGFMSQLSKSSVLFSE
ncbi:signal peptide peptidase SppA [Candidatus Babeliales bacterium]|nr:signal peptide peptidase SppA [Candidatus Babeliales bacterium]